MVDKKSLFKKEASMLAGVRVSLANSVCMYINHDSCDGAQKRCVLSEVSELVVTVKI